ncbi:MAG: osmotically inducible protein C, partial [Gammaproteobacteria bacterium]|nr:osmotically inducible protein C [Gammaproteobacteria bacterium]NIR95337.1 osmotically inducible protein C [Gammaproteobacteria bacterium]NIT54370.1 osmotically inducible protein C [candidate division Zixibacteria bacterium]NIW42878.1 osmotically inducible protein C [candidate division Zixibacteria bacterium]NIX58502.1 osmotically inducible protein C [candidate division Zixibacteria bacterium]
MATERYQFTNKSGATLSAYLDTTDSNDIRAYALFAHCFTCGKNLKSIKRINTTLADY